MWGLAFAVYAALKLLTWITRTCGSAPPLRHAAYLLAWPGMDANAFLTRPHVSARRRGSGPPPSARRFWRRARRLGHPSGLATDPSIPALLLGLIGYLFVLHFGTFHLLSCLWRQRGWEAAPLMVPTTGYREPERLLGPALERRLPRPDAPLRVSAAPPSARSRRRAARGFLDQRRRARTRHVRSRGRGLRPTHALLHGQRTGHPVREKPPRPPARLGRGLTGWLFTAAVLVLPLPLLLHAPFVQRIAMPFFASLGRAFFPGVTS